MLSLAPPKWIACSNNKCTERYCSEECRDTAWKSYHALLCTSGDSMHPFVQLYALAKYAERERERETSLDLDL